MHDPQQISELTAMIMAIAAVIGAVARLIAALPHSRPRPPDRPR